MRFFHTYNLHAENLKKANGSFSCPLGCGKEIEFSKMRYLAALTKKEQRNIEVMLAKNAFSSKTCICPNKECQSLIFIDDPKDLRVKCSHPKCKKKGLFCKKCREPWKAKASSKLFCGNNKCSQLSKLLAKKLKNCDVKTIGGIRNIPILRLCPNCQTVAFPFSFLLPFFSNWHSFVSLRIAYGAFVKV